MNAMFKWKYVANSAQRHDLQRCINNKQGIPLKMKNFLSGLMTHLLGLMSILLCHWQKQTDF